MGTPMTHPARSRGNWAGIQTKRSYARAHVGTPQQPHIHSENHGMCCGWPRKAEWQRRRFEGPASKPCLEHGAGDARRVHGGAGERLHALST
jgi:hypothetical protein